LRQKCASETIGPFARFSPALGMFDTQSGLFRTTAQDRGGPALAGAAQSRPLPVEPAPATATQAPQGEGSSIHPQKKVPSHAIFPLAKGRHTHYTLLMPTALHIAAPASQSRQGVGARLVRRLGGVVRSAIGSGINLAAALRRPAASQASRGHAAAQHPQAPTPSRLPLPRRPSPRSPSPVPPAALARATARPPSPPIRLRKPPRISLPRRHALHPGSIPPTQLPSLCGPQHAGQGLRSQDLGSGSLHIHPAHQRSHVARSGHHGSRGNAFRPLAPAERRAR